MTNFTDLTLEERQAMQRTLEADIKDNIENWRSYRKTYPNVENAGSVFVKNIVETEMQMEFNAAAINKLQAAQNAQPSNKPSGVLPRLRGH